MTWPEIPKYREWWLLKSLALVWIIAFTTAGTLVAQDQEPLPDVKVWKSDRAWWFDLKSWLNWTAALTIDKNWIVRVWPSLRLLEAWYTNKKWWRMWLWIDFAPQVEVDGDDFGKPEIGLGIWRELQSPRGNKFRVSVMKSLNETLWAVWLILNLSPKKSTK